MSGSSTANASGVYGTMSTPSTNNVPGARYGAVSWTDKSGNLWLFGGFDAGYLCNDLWAFNTTAKTWTWINGSQEGVSNPSGVYGTKGVAVASNVPASRWGGVGWTDGNGNLWLFGGAGYYFAAGASAYLNDLWEFNPTTKLWTWMSGSSTFGLGATGNYGTQGVAAVTNVPGARSSAVALTDASGNLWLFGGNGANCPSSSGSIECRGGNGPFLNDLWEFNVSSDQWTWVSGSDTGNAEGAYGSLGVAAVTNVPGARSSAVGWTDSSGNLWLFGGGLSSENLDGGYGNDLWEFNPTKKMWTWVGGSSTDSALGVYGTLGTPSSGNVPGARGESVSWSDSTGNLWLFGGDGEDAAGNEGDLNDLWRYQP